MTLRGVVTVLVYWACAACGPAGDASPENPQPTFDGADATIRERLTDHGERLANLLGCTGCHQDDFSGGPFNQGRIAPNLTLLLQDYSDSALDKAIRLGIAADGRKLKLMPSEMYQYLSEADLKPLIAYLRTLPSIGEPQPRFQPLSEDTAQWALAGYVDANTLARTWSMTSGPAELESGLERGRYLARTTCTECHNYALQGLDGFTPDLRVVATYSDEQLIRLFETGKGRTRDQLGLMTLVSPARFSHFTEAEKVDLIAYLRARADTMQR